MKPENSGMPIAFESRLTAQAAETGVQSLQINAARLARDARLLFHAKRYPSAAMLAAMALDEIGKILAVIELAMAETDPQIEAGWQAFRGPRHDFPWSVFVQDKAVMSDDDTNRLLALIGSIGRNVECLGAGVWTDPKQLIPEALAKELVATAEMICTHAINRRAIETWLRVAKTMPAQATTKQILARYRKALADEGLGDEAAIVAQLRENVPAAPRVRQTSES